MKIGIGLFFSGFLIVAAGVFSAAAQQTAALPSVSTERADAPALRVVTADDKTLELKAADLAKLPRREARGKSPHDDDGAEVRFSGVELREVLKLAGVKFGKEAKNAPLKSYLIVEAADDYRAVFALSELEADLTDKLILLADRRDGKPLSKTEGDWRLVVPDEKKPARWVRQIVRLKIRTIE